MYISETYVEVRSKEDTDGSIDEHRVGIGETDPYETFTDNLGRLFLSLQREYGRCVSSMYVDKGQEAKKIGWVFQKRVKYQDCKETYLQETWIAIHDAMPDHHTTYHYHYL